MTFRQIWSHFAKSGHISPNLVPLLLFIPGRVGGIRAFEGVGNGGVIGGGGLDGCSKLH